MNERRIVAIDTLEAEIADLETRKAECRTRAERKPINKRLHYLRHILTSVESLPGFGSNTREGFAVGGPDKT